jgi:predicted DCC family thiol-disulfide oxidoreductase YuxK
MKPELTVFYDGGCPVCRAEIAQYRRTPGAERCHWVDANQHSAGPGGPSRQQLLARLHVLDAEGRWHSGAAAFAQLWRRLPAWAWLGEIARLPAALSLMETGYRGFLGVRRLWRRPA